MPRVRYTADGGHYRVGGYGFDPGDVKDVEEELADYLAETDEFELVAGDDVEADESTNDSDATDDDSDESVFDVAEFLDDTVDEVADDIRAGEVDGHLDDIAQQADRVTVSDAIGERRAELEG